MGFKHHKPVEIVTKLRQVDVLVGQGMSRPDAVRQVSVTEQTYYRPLSVIALQSLVCQREACGTSMAALGAESPIQ